MSTLQMFHPFRELQWRADCIRAEDFPGTTASELLQNSKTLKDNASDLKVSLIEQSSCPCSTTSIWTSKGLLHYQFEKQIKMYALRFIHRHWVFLGPGEESKWYQGYAVNCGKWELRASPIVEDFENSGKFEILSTSMESLTTLIFFSELSMRRISSVFTEQSHGCVEGSQRQTPERQVKADQKVLEEHPEKFRSNRKNASQRLIFRDFRLLRKTECFRTWKIPNQCPS